MRKQNTIVADFGLGQMTLRGSQIEDVERWKARNEAAQLDEVRAEPVRLTVPAAKPGAGKVLPFKKASPAEHGHPPRIPPTTPARAPLPNAATKIAQEIVNALTPEQLDALMKRLRSAKASDTDDIRK